MDSQWIWVNLATMTPYVRSERLVYQLLPFDRSSVIPNHFPTWFPRGSTFIPSECRPKRLKSHCIGLLTDLLNDKSQMLISKLIVK